MTRDSPAATTILLPYFQISRLLYYVDELNVYEIAEVLSVTTGRVSQIKSAAVKTLRNLIETQVND